MKLLIAATLVVTLYSAFWLGQARGATGMLLLAREEQQAIVVDYEDALAQAQREYDALRDELSAEIGRLKHELEVAQDTREYWREETLQAKTERDVWKRFMGY